LISEILLKTLKEVGMGQELKIGDIAPDFNLPGVDGNEYSLADFEDKKVMVVIFSCNHCPYVQAYEDRIISLQEEFKGKGVIFIAINSNDDKNYPEDSFDNMVKRAKQKGFNFPYLRDGSQNIAHAYGATHTPQIFVFDERRNLRYTGKIDDNWREPSKVRERYLRDAILDLLEGKDIKNPETHAIGCTIKWTR
jgi:peroxiredoxin